MVSAHVRNTISYKIGGRDEMKVTARLGQLWESVATLSALLPQIRFSARRTRIGMAWWLTVFFLLASAVSVQAGSINYRAVTYYDRDGHVIGGGAFVHGYTNFPVDVDVAVTIASSYGGYSVTAIEDSAFSGFFNLTSVTIPNSVTIIGSNAFFNCGSLRGVYFQGNAPGDGSDLSVFSYDDNAIVYYQPGTTGWGATFDGRPTRPVGYDYTTNNGMSTITKYTGSGGAVVIPIVIAGLPVASIGSSAFSNCTSVVSVTIGTNVTSFGDYAFADCASLTGVCFQGNAPVDGSNLSVFSGDDNAIVYYQPGTTGWGATFDGRPTRPVGYDFTTNNGTTTITKYSGPGGAVVIPGVIAGLPVASIGSSAFSNCTSMMSVAIPDSVTNLGAYAFFGCTSLTNIMIPNNVTSIGDRAFQSSSALTSVTIPNRVTSIGYAAFEFCVSLTNVVIANSVTSIGNYAFCYCLSLTNVTIPDSVTSISDYSFYNCTNLTSVTMLNGVTNIGYAAFANCTKLTSVTIPDSVTSIGILAFLNGTNLTSVTIGNGVTSIGQEAFEQTSLTNVTIPASVTNIGIGAFHNCTNLTSGMIGNGVTSIGLRTFYGCSNLTCVTIGNGVTSIGQYAFQETGLTNVTIPASVTNIGIGAFASCTNLTSVTIGNGVTNIESLAFIFCSRLTSAYFKGNAPSLGGNVFAFGGNASVYYLPGTTNWGSWFGGLATVLWNPQIQCDACFGVRSNRFGFAIAGTSNLSVIVDICTNLANSSWVPAGTNTLADGSSYFGDSEWTNYPVRFYRIHSPF